MGADEPQFLDVGEGRKRRRIAYRLADANGGGPALLWLPGFLSDMASTKALALADWAERARPADAPLRLFGPRADPRAICCKPRSAIGWRKPPPCSIALPRAAHHPGRLVDGRVGRAARSPASSREQAALQRLAGLVLIAPAWDMTERLMWHRMTDEIKATIERDGVYYEPSLYGDPYPITKHLIEDGRQHLIGEDLLDLDLPVRILQGMCDPDVPWGHALDLVDLLCCDDVELTLIKDGDHRQSREHDLRRLEATVAALIEKASPAT